MKRYFVYLLALLLASCYDIKTEYLVDRYYLVVTDVDEDRSISYSLEDGNYAGGIPPMVSAVWHNADYIIAKQHPIDNNGDCIYRITQYYIIPIKSPVSPYPDENLIGPLAEDEYKKTVEKLGIKEQIIFESF